jgi:hypothetical protein
MANIFILLLLCSIENRQTVHRRFRCFRSYHVGDNAGKRQESFSLKLALTAARQSDYTASNHRDRFHRDVMLNKGNDDFTTKDTKSTKFGILIFRHLRVLRAFVVNK